MSDSERNLSERAIAWLLEHVQLAKLASGVYRWILKQAAAWIERERERVEAEAPEPTVQVKVTAAPANTPTDKEMWERGA